MLRISKLSDYAIIILGHMAKAPEATYAATDLAESAGLAGPTVSKVLKALARADVLRSTRGAKGGYQLARPPEATSVASIIAALEGPIALTECGLEGAHCEQSPSCGVRANWSVLNRAIQRSLESITLSDMASPMQKAPEGFRIPFNRISVQSRRITE
jgi:FeS assembly SUF system regulator